MFFRAYEFIGQPAYSPSKKYVEQFSQGDGAGCGSLPLPIRHSLDHLPLFTFPPGISSFKIIESLEANFLFFSGRSSSSLP